MQGQEAEGARVKPARPRVAVRGKKGWVLDLAVP